MEMLGRDALAVLDAAKADKMNWCGLSMGGMVGMWLGANAPERIIKLILSNTSAYYGDKDLWNGRIKTVREKGLGAIVEGTMERWFTRDFRDHEPAKVDKIRQMFLSTRPEGFIGCSEAVRDMDHREIITSIKLPTMIIAGRHDTGTTVENAEFIRSRIPGASMTVLDAAHISNIEQSLDYTDRVLGFLLQK
jgi:3-oxoadipate enol-lactonase